MNKKDLLKVVAQAFYGNRTATEIRLEELDKFILGYLDNSIIVTEKIDRSIIEIPSLNNVVIVYNKYQEEEILNKNYKKPLVDIPENNVKIYSRCVVCRINDNGELESLQNGDYEKFAKYLTM